MFTLRVRLVSQYGGTWDTEGTRMFFLAAKVLCVVTAFYTSSIKPPLLLPVQVYIVLWEPIIMGLFGSIRFTQTCLPKPYAPHGASSPNQRISMRARETQQGFLPPYFFCESIMSNQNCTSEEIHNEHNSAQPCTSKKDAECSK